MSELPSVFSYDNYRHFLRAYYEAAKLRNKAFSFRYFAKVAGFNSHNFLRMVMIGKGNLSEESIVKFTKAFKFNKEEAQFFRNLVLFNQAKSAGEKQLFAEEMLRSRSFREIHPLSESQYRYFKHWYFTAVRELVGLPGFVEDYDKIAKQIRPPISPREAMKAVEELINLGLLKRENGKLMRTEALVKTTDEVTSTYVSHWHKEYLKRAAESIDNVKREERDITAVYINFDKKNLGTLKELIRKFREDVMKLENQQENPDSVYQVNLQLFPVATIRGDDS